MTIEPSMNRRMHVASAFLCIFGGFGLIQGLWAVFFPKQAIDAIATMLGEELQSPTIVHYYLCQTFGLFSTLGSVVFIVISLIPFRKKEKWAWYTILVVGILMISASIILYVQDISNSTTLVNSFYTLSWLIACLILGLGIPAKQILGKH